MAEQLETVASYISQARTILQDTVPEYRYDDAGLLNALNNGMLEARRLRPDLFIGVTPFPMYTANDSTAVALDLNYRMSLVYYMAGFVQLRDDEINQDGRATVFINKFTSQLLSMQA